MQLRTRPWITNIFLVICLFVAWQTCLREHVQAKSMKIAMEPSQDVWISASDGQIMIHLPENTQSCQIESGPVYEEPTSYKPLHDGVVSNDVVSMTAIAGGVNRLYHRFRVTANGVTYLRWVTNVDRLPKYKHTIPWPKEVKGVSCPVEIQDLVDLGARHTHLNINLGKLLLPESEPDPDSEWILQREGYRIRLNPQQYQALDSRITALTEGGVNVIAVVLNIAPMHERDNHPLIHPDAYLDDPAFSHYAFNLSNHKNVVLYTALMEFLAERYSRPDKRYGWIGGYIIGNEVDSHWTWHNMGPADLNKVARHYINEVRLAWLSIRQAHADIPVFISLTHSWARPNSQDPLRNLSGRKLLDRLVELSNKEGNFRWNIAYHPYPQDLRNPRFWHDDLATFGYDTPMVTFRNLEVLSGYLGLPVNQIQGRSRRLILSEQGFDTPQGADGEDIQAAAYALSYERIRRIPNIEAYILHRHVDHRGEDGLRLGLWTAKQIPDEMSTPDRKKRSWYVFKAAGSPQWQAETRFALPIVGLDSWDDVYLQTGPIPDHAPEPEVASQYGTVVISLIHEIDDASVSDVLECTTRILPQADGGVKQAIYLHPMNTPGIPATISYQIKLPVESGLELHSSMSIDTGNGDGVIYRVVVNEDVLLEHEAVTNRLNTQHVSLEKFAGKDINLRMEVHPKDDNRHDWAYWIDPMIVIRKTK